MALNTANTAGVLATHGLADYKEGRKLGKGAYGAAVLATRRADGKEFVFKKVVMRNVKSEKERREVKREVPP